MGGESGEREIALSSEFLVSRLSFERLTYAAPLANQRNLTSFIPHPISDSIWLANGALLVGAGHQMLLYGQAAAHSPDDAAPKEETLFEYAARSNGPLPDYHPQMLLQCLLWGKLNL